MSDALSFAELDEQHVELLSGRTVLSLLSLSHGGGVPGHNGSGHNGISFGSGTNTTFGGSQSNIAGKGIGGAGGSAY